MRARKTATMMAIALSGEAASLHPLRTARAQTSDAAMAQTLFDEGKKLAAAGDCEQALAKFEASQKIERSVGPLLNMGNCNEVLGRTATAWARFVEAETLARQREDHEREAYAHQRATALLPKLERLTISAPMRVPGLVIVRDGVVVDGAALGVPVPIDPGRHVVEAKADGYRSVRVVVDAKTPGETIATEVPPLERDPDAPGYANSSGTQRTLAFVTAGIAVGGAAMGTIFGLLARSRWHAAEATCVDAGCPDSGQSLATDARRFATVSTVSFIVSGASAVTSTILFVTLPSTEVRVAPMTTGAAGLSFSGAF